MAEPGRHLQRGWRKMSRAKKEMVSGVQRRRSEGNVEACKRKRWSQRRDEKVVERVALCERSKGKAMRAGVVKQRAGLN